MVLTEKYTRANIKAIPLAQLQEEFIAVAIDGKVDSVALQQFIAKLNNLPSGNEAAFEFEKSKVSSLLASGQLLFRPFINTPETSLLWAMVLAHKANEEKERFYEGQLWKEFAGQDGVAQREKENLSFHIASSGINRHTRLGWEKLGGSYFFDYKNHYIGLDLILSLAAGFDSARAAALHEIAHSKLTVDFTEKMKVLHDRVEELLEKGKTSTLTEGEYEELNGKQNEWSQRFAFADECENNVVDRWVVNRSTRMNTDYAYERNYVEATIVDGLRKNQPKSTDDTPANRLSNLKLAIRYSFMCNNGYFPDTEQGWAEAGVNQAWITLSNGKPGFNRLRELCGGENGIENLQPQGIDAIKGVMWLAEATKKYSQKRNAVIDEIYDVFAAPLYAQLPKEPPKQQPASEQNKQDGKGQGNSGSSSPSAGGNSGQGQNNSKQSGQQESEQPESKKSGQNNDDASSQGSSPNRSANSGQSSGGQNDPSQADSKQPGDKKNKPGNESSGSNPANNVPENMPQAGKGVNAENQPGRSKTKIKVEGRGEVEAEVAPPAKPQDSARETTNQKTEEQQTLEELLQSREEHKELGDDNESAGEHDQQQAQQRRYMPTRGGVSNYKPKAKIGDWSDYNKCRIEFSSDIREMQLLLDGLREKQIRYTKKQGKEYSLKPSDGNMGRLDKNRHVEMIKGFYHNGTITEESASRFREDTKKPEAAQNTLVFLPDGSGSMHMPRSGKYSPIDSAVHAACIFNEALKSDVRTKRNTDFYTGLWGNNTPMMIVQPGDEPLEIQKRIAGIKQDDGWGTALAPSIISTIKLLSEKKPDKPNLRMGHIHIVVFSDGGITDSRQSAVVIERMLQTIPYSTIDFVINESENTDMDKLAKSLQNKFGDHRVGLSHHAEAETIIDGLKHIVDQRGKLMPPTPAITATKQISALKNAYVSISTAGAAR